MRILLSLFIISASPQISFSANVPAGYNCTSDEFSICEAGTGEQEANLPDFGDTGDDDTSCGEWDAIPVRYSVKDWVRLSCTNRHNKVWRGEPSYD